MNTNTARYSCQMNLPGFGAEKQGLLSKAKVLIIGAGGLGCPSAQYLAASGVGTLGIVDFDVVSMSNLHRQILYGTQDIGELKVEIACRELARQNPEIRLVAHNIQIVSENIMDIISDYHIIIDATDNFESRYLINDACCIAGKPVIYGAIYQYEGQVAVWNIPNADGSRSPNFRDLYPKVDSTQIPNCSTGGIIPTLAGIIGCLQANEAIKYITHSGELLSGKMLLINTQTMENRLIKLGNITHTTIKDLLKTFEIPTITSADLKIGLSEKTLTLVDVRTDTERDEFHIGGEHFELDELEEYLGFFEQDKTYVFYCSSGKRSAEAVRLLKSQKPSINSLSLKGGVGEWISFLER